MIAHPIKQLLTLIGQAGGTLTLPLAELHELGVEISAQNICSDKEGVLVLRLGPKIYYIPAPQEDTGQWQPEITNTETARGVLPKSAPIGPRVPDPLTDELEAVNRITNRPRPRPPQQVQTSSRQRPAEPPSIQRIQEKLKRARTAAQVAGQEPDLEEDVLPHSKVGVHHLDDAALWLREQATEMDKREIAKRHRAEELREGDLPFRVIPGR